MSSTEGTLLVQNLPLQHKTMLVRGYDSNVGKSEVGVPQGSCIGLLLVYLNDLTNITQGKVSMYADNTNLCHMSNDIGYSSWKQFNKWSNGNKGKIYACLY